MEDLTEYYCAFCIKNYKLRITKYNPNINRIFDMIIKSDDHSGSCIEPFVDFLNADNLLINLNKEKLIFKIIETRYDFTLLKKVIILFKFKDSLDETMFLLRN